MVPEAPSIIAGGSGKPNLRTGYRPKSHVGIKEPVVQSSYQKALTT